MAEVIGGAFFSSFFQQVFQKMDSKEVKNFIRGKKRTDKLLKKLRILLLSVNNVYDDAEDKQLTNLAVREWLGDLKEAILGAEDLLDKVKTEALRRKLEADRSGSSTSAKVHQFLSDSFHAFDESVDTKIEEIIESLDFIAQQKDALELKTGARPFSYTLPSTSLVEVSSVYGRDEDKDAIMKLLLANDATGNKLDVVPIVGMGGIGKTTLAQLVFNDEKVTSHFNLRAWVCVSDDFDVVKITQIIYMSVTSQANCDITDPNLLQVELKKALTGKKFLFVLDDVWNENFANWDYLRRPFESGACGSKIIVTTRNEGVASVMGTLQTRQLPLISDEDCWSLFEKHAFENKNVSAHPTLEVIGRKIVRKCKGLPLAAKSLGGLLRSISNEEEWKNVLESDIWELSDKECNILPALWLSYRYLPPHLKRCFAYSSIYPKDYQFQKNDLVLLWMAEDLVQPKKKKTAEEVGENYFNDLISRSFFQRSEDILRRPVFTMHDLINDLAKFVSGDFCVRLEDNDSFNDMSKTRHFSYMKDDNLDLEKIGALYEAECMRTFLHLSTGKPESSIFVKVLPDLLLKLQCLRVLNFSGYAIRELPDSVSKLIHLRYLNLSDTWIKKLPDAVCGLYNLQTLLLTHCEHFAQLPTGFGRLIHLRHVDFSGTKLANIPSEMYKLKNLQRFPLGKFDLDNETGNNIVDLKELQELHGDLFISGLDNIVHAGDALGSNMREKKYLTELILEWVGDTDDPRKDQEVLDNLRPHTNIREVTIRGYGGTNFPDWLGDDCFSNLVAVRLWNCANCFSLPARAQFPALEELRIHSCANLVCFPDGGLHAPNLRSIQIWDCTNLRSLPEEMRTLLPSLNEIWIHKCPELQSFPEGGLPCKLEILRISFCGKLVEKRMQWGLLQLTSLRFLSIQFQNCEEEIDSFPEEGLLPTTLTHLEFGCLSNLKTINSKELKRLISLQSLEIHKCPKLQCLPDDGLPISLSDLTIYDCPLVTQRCKEDKGEDWPKIAHIPEKYIH
ncbi:hypothetical protein M0R45_015592 [Rubus argutus]|uniref:Disease resistance RPP13-like protein 1 n=1 Tax=Rubus argutus TaxID=59490 RepID=A0AAW1XQ14_RUBAR